MILKGQHKGNSWPQNFPDCLAMPGSRQTRALRRSWFVGPFSRLYANATQKVLGVYRMLDEKLGRGQHEDRVERIAKGAENTDDRQRSPSFRRTPHSRSV